MFRNCVYCVVCRVVLLSVNSRLSNSRQCQCGLSGSTTTSWMCSNKFERKERCRSAVRYQQRTAKWFCILLLLPKRQGPGSGGKGSVTSAEGGPGKNPSSQRQGVLTAATRHGWRGVKGTSTVRGLVPGRSRLPRDPPASCFLGPEQWQLKNRALPFCAQMGATGDALF